jgi:hypothetical protein
VASALAHVERDPPIILTVRIQRWVSLVAFVLVLATACAVDSQEAQVGSSMRRRLWLACHDGGALLVCSDGREGGVNTASVSVVYIAAHAGHSTPTEGVEIEG